MFWCRYIISSASASAISLMKLAVQGGIEAPLNAGLALEKPSNGSFAKDSTEGWVLFWKSGLPVYGRRMKACGYRLTAEPMSLHSSRR